MAISPDKARISLTEQEKVEIEDLEKEIDIYLSLNTGKEMEKSDLLFKFGKRIYNQRVIDELVRRYLRAGWANVKFETGGTNKTDQFLNFIEYPISHKE